jgi:RNA-directed DNA polymerase
MSPDIFHLFGTTKEEVVQLVEDRHLQYISYPIRKRSGKKPRFIDAPCDRLKEIQNEFLKNILYKFRTNSIAHGFVAGRDPKTNASQHVGATCIIKMDLKDFFGSVKEKMVLSTLRALLPKRFADEVTTPMSIDDLVLIAKLLTYKGRVPQGAPTSPALTNLYVLAMDSLLKALAKNSKLTVTRYADDITFSSQEKLGNLQKTQIIQSTKQICSRFGLRLNHKKTRIRTNASRISVTGVVVNVKPNLAKPKYRTLRARVHNYYTGTLTLDTLELQSLRGQIEWLRSINPSKAQPLLKKLGEKMSEESSKLKSEIQG